VAVRGLCPLPPGPPSPSLPPHRPSPSLYLYPLYHPTSDLHALHPLHLPTSHLCYPLYLPSSDLGALHSPMRTVHPAPPLVLGPLVLYGMCPPALHAQATTPCQLFCLLLAPSKIGSRRRRRPHLPTSLSLPTWLISWLALHGEEVASMRDHIPLGHTSEPSSKSANSSTVSASLLRERWGVWCEDLRCDS